MHPKAQIATLGLGGNIGDPVRAMASVVDAFGGGDASIRLCAVSRLYKTPPWGKLDQPDFYNACIQLETTLGPIELLDHCLSLELDLKRERIERWGPRTIDIDLLTYGEIVMETARLTIPHPRMHERAFVLMPLSEIDSSMQIAGRSVGDWLVLADKSGIAAVSENGNWWRS